MKRDIHGRRPKRVGITPQKEINGLMSAVNI